MNFSKILTCWYSANKRELPWRNTRNPYYIWLSEIILQQTQIKQGLPYYDAFVVKFPTVFDLANANEQDVLKLWQGLGYYSRARNLHYTAKYIAIELNGVFPNNYTDLLKLKGVGDYTASAIASICFDEVSAVVDGNVYRILSRYFGIHTPINSTQGIKEFKELASKLICTENPAEHNQAIMEFGARQCKPQNPDCSICPLNNSCAALRDNLISTLPVKLKKTKISKKHINFLVVLCEDHKVLFEKRTKKGIWQNLYQFPLIETDTDLEAKHFESNPHIKDFFRETHFNFSLYNDKPLIHKLSHQHLYTKFWIITSDSTWNESISISDITNFPTPILISNFIDTFDFQL
ncbi:A/G-specific adenine glycosylase [Flavobacteriales bacterium 34_180_T64]|nr:A/G-specific adenine glycosylase [Flavobacteriales bacterium 34_180_T64]